MGPSIRQAKGNKKKNKGTKTCIVFDESSRKNFLTGFRKRKNERRKKAKEQLEKDLKEEIRKAKQKARDDVMKAKATGASHQIAPEIAHLLKDDCISQSVTQDYGTHTVSVTHLNGFGTNLGTEKEQTSEAKENCEDIDQSLRSGLKTNSTGQLGKNDRKNINKLAAKKVSKTRAFTATKQQLYKKGVLSMKANKAMKQEKKFSKKSAKPKRTKHHNPKKIT